MLVQLGNDADGKELLRTFFEANNVGTKHVKMLDGVETGRNFFF